MKGPFVILLTTDHAIVNLDGSWHDYRTAIKVDSIAPGSTIPTPDLLIPSHSKMGGCQGPKQPTQAVNSVSQEVAILMILLSVCTVPMRCSSGNPHTPLNLTWQLIRTTWGYIQDKNIIVQVSKAGPILTVFPNITVNLFHFYPPMTQTLALICPLLLTTAAQGTTLLYMPTTSSRQSLERPAMVWGMG